MPNFSLEYIPDIVIGRLLQTGVIANGAAITQSPHQELLLCLDIQISYEQFEEQLPPLVLAVGRAAAEPCLAYPQLHAVVVKILAPAERFRTEVRTLFIQLTMLADWQAGSISDDQFLEALLARADTSGVHTSEWRSLISTNSLRFEYHYAYHLDRIPRILTGKVQLLGLALEKTNIHRDKHGHLVLYAEFPIDEQTDGFTHQHILSITRCANEFLQAFPELQRLAIWTRPDYDDKVAISSFWIDRAVVLAWNAGEIADAQLLAARHDYNP